jgi:hypothetical protein
MNQPQHGHLPYPPPAPQKQPRRWPETDGSETDTERRMAEYARRVDADAPPLPEAQRTNIAALFTPAVRELMREARQREGGRS